MWCWCWVGVWCGEVGAGCGGMGVVEGYCCVVVVKCFLESCGELEFVVELVNGDEGSEALASFFGWGLEFFRGEAPFDVEESNRVGVTEDGGAEVQEGFRVIE